MKRSIIDYKKITPEMAALLLETYPSGYGDEDIISFKNAKGEWVEAVELQTGDVLYLVKVGANFSQLLGHIEEIESGHEEAGNLETIDTSFENEYDGSLESEDLH
ncbi:MAG: hypothetical protein RLZZ241_318 [Bacteroidota bacterium]|jgi:hypothetical protein